MASIWSPGTRTPKEDLVNALANVLEVSPLALKIPDIDSDLGFIHTLFAIEDIHGARAERQGDEVHIIFDGCKAEYGCVCLRNAVCLG